MGSQMSGVAHDMFMSVGMASGSGLIPLDMTYMKIRFIMILYKLLIDDSYMAFEKIEPTFLRKTKYPQICANIVRPSLVLVPAPTMKTSVP